jgi:hypothetical protein
MKTGELGGPINPEMPSQDLEMRQLSPGKFGHPGKDHGPVPQQIFLKNWSCYENHLSCGKFILAHRRQGRETAGV